MFWYLATPYTRFTGGLDAAYRCACFQAATLIRAGIPVFSPIAHTHPIAEAGRLDPRDVRMWLAVDRPMMEAAGGIIVCKLPGWDESHGVAAERDYFRRAGKPEVMMTPGTVPTLPRATVCALAGRVSGAAA